MQETWRLGQGREVGRGLGGRPQQPDGCRLQAGLVQHGTNLQTTQRLGTQMKQPLELMLRFES